MTIKADEVTKDYEKKIAEFEKKVQQNVKKLQEFSTGSNIISRLIKNERFLTALKERGCNVESLANQQEL